MRSVYAAVAAAALVVVGPVSSAVADVIRLPRATGGDEGSRVVASTDDTSVFPQASELADSVWSRCELVIWSADTRCLKAAQAQRAVEDLPWALEVRSRASWLPFDFSGPEALTFDEDAFALTPVGGAPLRHRHGDGDTASEIAHSQNPDVLIADLRLPGIARFELSGDCARIRWRMECVFRYAPGRQWNPR